MRYHRPILATLLTLAACGGQSGTLTVAIVTPVGDDPFAQAATARITLAAPGQAPVSQKTFSVSGGHFDASVDLGLSSGVGIAAEVVVEALAADGTVVGRGRTALLGLIPVSESVVVWVGRPGRVGRSVAVARGHAETASTTVPRLGALFAGGTVGGLPVADSEVYDQYTHTMTAGAPLPVARAGALALGFDRTSSATGAGLVLGGGATDATVFDPIASGTTAGAWSTVLSDPSLGRAHPSAAPLSDGSWLISGGLDGSGKPLASATRLSVGAQLSVAPTMPMAGARANHLTLAGKFAGEDGALVIGGGSPQIERFSTAKGTFSALPSTMMGDPLPGDASGFSATLLPDGRVLLAGGLRTLGDQRTASDGIALLAPDTLAVERREAVLPTARSGHVAFLAGGELVLCGGVGSDGKPVASCDVLDAATLAKIRTVPLALGRTGLAALTLDTGDVLLVGGADPATATTIELYTPLR